MADFLDTSASVDNSGGDRDRKGKRRSFGSPSGKQQSPFKKQTIRRAVEVCLKVNPKKNGSVSVIFPQAAESLREDVKLIMVDDARVCHWNPKIRKWSNERYDSTMTDVTLNCEPIAFIVAAHEYMTASEHCSAVVIIGPDGNKIELEDAKQLCFSLDENTTRASTSHATNNDIQSDLRSLHRLLALVAEKAGISGT